VRKHRRAGVSHLGHRLSALIDGELSDTQRERVLGHLIRCEPCRQEAAALRALKQRMHALGEATANTALTDRLVALGARYPGQAGLGLSRRRRPVRSIAVAALAVAGLGLPAAAFLAGGGQPEPGPSVTPAVDMFMMQHEISTGNAEVSPSPSPSVTGEPRAAGFWHHFPPEPAMAR
jgi:Putative zinc-finger